MTVANYRVPLEMFINLIGLLWCFKRSTRSWLHHYLNCRSIGLLSVSSVLVTSPALSSPINVVSSSPTDVVSHSAETTQLEKASQEYGDMEIDVGIEKQAIRVRKGEAESNYQLATHETQSAAFKASQVLTAEPSPPLDLDPTLIKRSPVLQRWLRQVPNVLSDIKRDPSFRTRLRLGYLQFPSTGQAAGLQVGIEDVFAGRSGLTLSADYQTAFNGKREAWGLDWRYYVRPLGSAVNLAPVVGYRHLKTTRYATEGMHVGLRLLLVPSRTGAADLSVTQSWVAPGSENAVGLTTLSFGYALTHNLRLSTEIQKQNSRFRSDSRVGIGLEWMF